MVFTAIGSSIRLVLISGTLHTRMIMEAVVVQSTGPLLRTIARRLMASQASQCAPLQAGVSTGGFQPFSSPIIFVTRYAICGDGVLETTYAVHNMMTGRTNRKSDEVSMAPMTAAARTVTEPSSSSGVENIDGMVEHNNNKSRRRLQPMVDWADDEIEETPVSIGIISLPWGGVRTSTLRDVVISRPDGSLLDSPPPRPQGFGDPRGHAPRTRDTGGFTIFAQDLPHPDNTPEFVLPCRLPDGQTVDFCSNSQMMETPGATRPSFIVGRDNPAHLDISWSRPWQDVIGLELQKTTTFHQGCLECQLQLTNPRTNATFPIKSVHHFIYQGTRFVFSPQQQGIGALDKLNSIFKAGDTIEITLADRGLRPEDNLALTHVHGTDDEYSGSSYFRMPTGIRYGLSHHVRDYTVWTVNAFPKIDPGDTFVSRQYFMVDRCTESARKAQEWVPETLQEQYDAGELPGNEIHLYAEDGEYRLGLSLVMKLVPEVEKFASGALSLPASQELYFKSSVQENHSLVGIDTISRLLRPKKMQLHSAAMSASIRQSTFAQHSSFLDIFRRESVIF